MPTWSAVKLSALTSDLRLDAEYYRPEYLRLANTVALLPTRPLSEIADVTDGNHISIAEQFAEEGVRYLRGQDLSKFFISDSDPVCIPEKTYVALARSHMFPGDVLVSIVGTIGAVGLVTDRFKKLTGSCKLAIVRAKSLPPEYIAIYLSSKMGQYEIARRTRGAVQMGLILPDLKSLPIVIPKQQIVDQIVSIVKAMGRAEARARQTFADAISTLTRALGLADSEPVTNRVHVSTYRAMATASRLDAEHFCMPGLRGWKAPYPTLPLGDSKITSKLASGTTPAASEYDDEGLPIVKVGDVDWDGLAVWGGERVGTNAPAAKSLRGELRPDDVVLLSAAHHIRYIGKAGLFAGIEQHAGPVRSVGELITVRASGRINARALCLYLNLPAVRNELQRHVRGLSAHLYPDDIRHIPVPLLPPRLQEGLAEAFDQSIANRNETERLLRKAIGIVEEIVGNA